MLAARRLVLSALGPARFLQRGYRRDAPVHSALVERRAVVALVSDGSTNVEPASLRFVDQAERMRLLRLARGLHRRCHRKVVLRIDSGVDLVAVIPTALAGRDCGAVAPACVGVAVALALRAVLGEVTRGRATRGASPVRRTDWRSALMLVRTSEGQT